MAQTGKNIESLKRIDNEGVMKTWDTFAEKKQRFTDIGLEIRSVNRSICGAWGGTAFGEYTDQFDNIFSQVEDIGDALTQIADSLKEVIYDGFYVADDSLNQQLLEAQHNSGKGSGGGGDASSGPLGYTKLSPKPVLYSTLGQAYKPNLSYPQLPARPILVSTIGQAYTPNLSYQAMSPKPVLSSCLPSATTIDLTYRSLTARSVLQSVIGDALNVDISYMQLALRSVLSSTIGQPVTPDMSYQGLPLRDVLSSVIGTPYIPDLSWTPMGIASMNATSLIQCLMFLLNYANSPSNLQQVQNTMMAAKVNQIVIESMAQGRSDEETAQLIGAAVLGNVHGNLDAENRATLEKVVGTSVFQNMYGRAPGETAPEGTRVNWVDTAGEKNTLGMIRDVVNVATNAPVGTFASGMTNVHACSNMASVLNLQTGAGTVNSTNAIIAPREALGIVASEKVATAMSSLASAGNVRAVEQAICQCAAQKNGGASILPINPTIQNVTGNIITIGAGGSSITPSTMSSIITGNMDPAASANITNVVNQWSAGAGKFDFSSIQYPSTIAV